MVARQCYTASLQTTPQETLLIEMLDPRDEQKIKRAASTDELLQIPFDEQSFDRFFKISSGLNKEDQAQLTSFLRKNVDIFAWTASDMPGVSPDVITHRLNVNPAYHSVIQKKKEVSHKTGLRPSRRKLPNSSRPDLYAKSNTLNGSRMLYLLKNPMANGGSVLIIPI